jgi:hypothetical protein
VSEKDTIEEVGDIGRDNVGMNSLENEALSILAVVKPRAKTGRPSGDVLRVS